MSPVSRRLRSAAKSLIRSTALSSPSPSASSSSSSSSSSSTSPASAAAAILHLLPCKRRRKLLKQLTSPRVAPIQREPSLHLSLPALDAVLLRDAALRFFRRARSFLATIPHPHRVPIPSPSHPHHRLLGVPRGRKIAPFVLRHPLLLHLPRLPSPYIAFTPLMISLLSDERRLVSSLLPSRITAVRKLLMITKDRRIPLSKLYHCRALFGLPDDFRDQVLDYPQYFRITIDPDDNNRRVLELEEWDPSLAVSALERDFLTDEARVRQTFHFSVPHDKDFFVDENDRRKLDSVTAFPLISPYSDGSGLQPWTVEAEKYRVGLVHEFLSLTLEKRAWIHHIVEFKEELGLINHVYKILAKQRRAFYLSGTEMNWAVFLRSAYSNDGMLIEKDTQVVFNEKLERIACMSEEEAAKEGIFSGVASGEMPNFQEGQSIGI